MIQRNQLKEEKLERKRKKLKKKKKPEEASLKVVE